MCRFLVLRGDEPFDPAPLLSSFRERCHESPEFQGHGWGMACRTSEGWNRYRSLTPIWEDAPSLPEEVDFLVVHARSAFRNEGIEVENNMPFYRDRWSYVFNGELRGVRVQAPGRTGAEKIFHLILERESESVEQALVATDRLLRSRSRYVRGMNVALTDGEAIYAHCRFSEQPDYFTLHWRSGELTGVCSVPLDGAFQPMENGETRVLR
jgi:predicted glutamine amidotransferase